QFSFGGQTIGPPVVTANQASKGATAGQTVAVDSAVTVSSPDIDVTGATMTIGTGYQGSADTLHFSTQNGISSSYAAGVLTLTGSATPAQYQSALASVTFSSTSTSTATRNISIVVSDSSDTGNVKSNTATTLIAVSAPITITAAYVAGSNWTTPSYPTSSERFDTYLVNNGLGDAATPTVGYALRTGVSQTTDLPWVNVDTISVTFSGAVGNIGLGSLKLVGGTGGGAVAAPTATGFASDGSNTYSWTFPTALGNNKYIFAIASTGSSFGTLGSTRVTDANGAGISGTFVTGQAFPSGNGMAGSTFDFAFSVLPADGQRQATVNSADTAEPKALANRQETNTGYSPYYDYYGAGLINSVAAAVAAADSNKTQSGITAPTAPAIEPVGGTGDAVDSTGLAALALGVQESGSLPPNAAAAGIASNGGSASPPATATSLASTGSAPGTESESAKSSSSATATERHGRHNFAAVDEAVSDFDPTDRWDWIGIDW
ncbi:MAG TPA: hypothetical protein VGG30_04495, partial [Pirellulales bacterium]